MKVIDLRRAHPKEMSARRKVWCASWPVSARKSDDTISRNVKDLRTTGGRSDTPLSVVGCNQCAYRNKFILQELDSG